MNTMGVHSPNHLQPFVLHISILLGEDDLDHHHHHWWGGVRRCLTQVDRACLTRVHFKDSRLENARRETIGIIWLTGNNQLFQ